jgi:hypothetical protein
MNREDFMYAFVRMTSPLSTPEKKAALSLAQDLLRLIKLHNATHEATKIALAYVVMAAQEDCK